MLERINITNRANNRPPSRPFFARGVGRSFEITADAGSDSAEIELYDEIGYWGVDAKQFRQALKATSAKTINLKINSPGGDVFDGIAMFNDLIQHDARIEVDVNGLAASAASIVAMAGDEIRMASNAFLMIHNSWAVGIGDRNDMFAMGGLLQQIDEALAGTYAERTGIEIGEISSMMDSTTWLSAAAAEDQGFADATTPAVEASTRFDLAALKNVPDAFADWKIDRKPTKRDLEQGLRDAGASRTQARATLAQGYDPARFQRDAEPTKPTPNAALKRLVETISR